MIALKRWILALLLLSHSVFAVADALPVKTLQGNKWLIEVEVAATETARRQGLMFRQKMADNHGMLFIFAADEMQCMWMRNTLIPLSVAFLDSAARIVNIEDMAPLTYNIHCAQQPVRFALEMNQGWFSAHGINEGSGISGIVDKVEKR